MLEFTAVSSPEGVHSITQTTDKSHSASLFHNLELLLKKNSITIRDIDLIAVGTGPGSFTGIRKAVSSARMFAQILRIPLMGIKSQLLYALSMESSPGANLLAAIDAKKGRVFGALYKMGEDPLHPIEVIEPGDYSVEHLLEKIDRDMPTIAAGDGIAPCLDKISTALVSFSHLKNMNFSGTRVAGHVEKIFRANPITHEDYLNVVPCYSRVSDAELNLKKKTG